MKILVCPDVMLYRLVYRYLRFGNLATSYLGKSFGQIQPHQKGTFCGQQSLWDVARLWSITNPNSCSTTKHDVILIANIWNDGAVFHNFGILQCWIRLSKFVDVYIRHSYCKWGEVHSSTCMSFISRLGWLSNCINCLETCRFRECAMNRLRNMFSLNQI